MSVHFVCARDTSRAVLLVSDKTNIPRQLLSAVCLRMDEGPPKEEAREKYLGPLDQFSPVEKQACLLCRGIGKIPGTKPPEPCGVCGGSGFKKMRVSRRTL